MTEMLQQKIIHLNSVDSTNNYTAKMVELGSIQSGTVIMAEEQTKGRGQRGNAWQSEPGQNLQFSIYLKPKNILVHEQKSISHCVSLALIKTFESYGVKAHIKWPNDLFIGDRKIAGLLIENSLKGEKIESSIIGVGLNVNQGNFPGLFATSFFLETGIKYDRKEVLLTFLNHFNALLSSMENGLHEGLLTMYYKHMIGYKQIRKYRDKNGDFIGIIDGINLNGNLVIYRNGDLTEYDIQQVTFIW